MYVYVCLYIKYNDNELASLNQVGRKEIIYGKFFYI